LQNNRSVHESSSKMLLKNGNSPKDSKHFGSTYDKYKNVYYKEVSKDFQNRDGPGPGYYLNGKEPQKSNKIYSFPKNDRKLANNTQKNNSPSPSTYRYESGIKKVKEGNHHYKFGTSKRDFDFSKCRCLLIGLFILFSVKFTLYSFISERAHDQKGTALTI